MSTNDGSMDISIENEYILYTGGCNGVDRCTEDIAISGQNRIFGREYENPCMRLEEHNR